MDGGNLVGVRHQLGVGAAPQHVGAHDVAGAGGIVIQLAEHRHGGQLQSQLLGHLPVGRGQGLLPRVDPATGQGPLAGMAVETRGAAGEQEGGAAGGAGDQPAQAARLHPGDGIEASGRFPARIMAVALRVAVDHDHRYRGEPATLQRTGPWLVPSQIGRQQHPQRLTEIQQFA